MDPDVTNAASVRRTRVALMGEFSAGKSTLCNLLLGKSASPVQITATQLPPVWYRLGDGRACLHFQDGRTEDVECGNLAALAETGAARISVELDAPLLEHCDLIDMPGTSDPNMPMEIWQALLPQIDMVIWCTPASQAWRQTEAALWEEMPEALWSRSILLITRADKIGSDRDRARVLARVSREVEGMFDSVLAISLTQALAANGDRELLAACGAALFEQKLMTLLGLDPTVEEGSETPENEPVQSDEGADDPAPSHERVVPRRVGQAKSTIRPKRPERIGSPEPRPRAGA